MPRLLPRPPRRLKVVSEPGFAERTWRVLDKAIDDIYEHNSNKLSFEELYRAAYNMGLQKCGAELYASVERKIRGRLETVANKIADKVRLVSVCSRPRGIVVSVANCLPHRFAPVL